MAREITILTPAYNRADTLPRLYESLLSQTYQNFIWLVMDDGSTDNTRELIEKYKAEGKLEIEYHWHENVKKLITTVRGFHKVTTPYLYSVDSDDTLPADALQILYDEMQLIKDNDEFSAVIGRLENQYGEVQGTPFPSDHFDSTWFYLVNRDKVKGPHEGIQKTSSIKKILIDVEMYAGKGYVYDVWNFYLDAAFKTRFINKVVYTYFLDENDNQSLTNTKFSKKNAYGLSETHRHYVNAYAHKYFAKYPLPILKQLFKYIYYGLNSNQISLGNLVKGISSARLKIITLAIFPIVFFYSKFKPMK